MPTNDPSNRLEWTEENLEKALSQIYQEIETDEALRERLIADPFAVLSTRIAIPESFRTGLFAKDKGKEAIVLYVPTQGGAGEAMPEGTAEVTPQPKYEILCTVYPIW